MTPENKTKSNNKNPKRKNLSRGKFRASRSNGKKLDFSKITVDVYNENLSEQFRWCLKFKIPKNDKY